MASAILVAYCGAVLELSAIDIEPIASALEEQEDYEHAWLVDPSNGETIFWSTYGGWRSEGRTEPMVIESLPVYEDAEEWQADR